MSPPSWLYWPTAVSAVDYQINADLVANTTLLYNVTNVIEVGDAGSFAPTASNPLRYIASTNDVVRFVFSYTGTLVASDMSNATLTNVTDGIEFSPSSVTFQDVNGTAMLVNFNGSGTGNGSTADVFWKTLEAGHEIQVVLEYA